MKATIDDFRYKMHDVLKALDRKEEVTVLYRGKVKGVLVPSREKTRSRMSEHPFFGMSVSSAEKTVVEEMNDLRGSRFDDQ